MNEPLLVDPYAAHAATGIKPAAIRKRLSRGTLTPYGYDRQGRALVDLNELTTSTPVKAA